jgi:transcriptional regulator with XRE-family HTH domain
MTGQDDRERGREETSRSGKQDTKPLHQLSEARRRQGLSMRCVAKRLQTSIAEVRQQEDVQHDLKLSDLYRWQAALQVPLDELLYEPDEALSPRILDRARMLRVMKTAQAMRSQARSPGLKRLAETLVQQLLDLMPELESVSAWPSVGQRRTSDEMGKIVENPIPEHWFHEGS